MYNVRKLIELEQPLIENDPFKIYRRKGEKHETTRALYRGFKDFIAKQGRLPNNPLEEIFPILAYKSHYRGNFYSRLVNYHHEEYEIDIWNYFKDWLKYSLSQLPSHSGIVYHHVDRSFLSSPEEFVENFRRQIGKTVIFKKFISTSKHAGWGCDVHFTINLLPMHSMGKDTCNIFYEDNLLGEQEVLFNWGARFKISSVERSGNQYYISLSEIEKDPLPQLEYCITRLCVFNQSTCQ